MYDKKRGVRRAFFMRVLSQALWLAYRVFLKEKLANSLNRALIEPAEMSAFRGKDWSTREAVHRNERSEVRRMSGSEVRKACFLWSGAQQKGKDYGSFIFLTFACEIFRRKISLATAGCDESLVFVERSATKSRPLPQKNAID